MRLLWRRFDRVGLARIVQLINKTNQFNLTTRRYTEADVLAVMDDQRAFGAAACGLSTGSATTASSRSSSAGCRTTAIC